MSTQKGEGENIDERDYQDSTFKKLFMYLISAALLSQYLNTKTGNENCVLYSNNSRFFKCHGRYTDSISRS